jgi:hypothetical protein
MTQKQMVRVHSAPNLQDRQFGFGDNELRLVKVLLVALEQDSYQEFRNRMLDAISEFPDLFRNEHFSQDQISQIQKSFHEETYVEFRQVLMSIENRCGSRWCIRESICPACEFLMVADSLSYEYFKAILKRKLLERIV